MAIESWERDRTRFCVTGKWNGFMVYIFSQEQLWIAASATTKYMTARDKKKCLVDRKINLSGSFILYTYISLYCYKYTPLDIFYKSDFKDWHQCNFFITATYGSLPCCQNMAMFQPQGTAGLNLKLRLFSNIDPEFYFTPSDTIKEK